MPLDVPGCTRATMIIAVSISFITHRMRVSIIFACLLHVLYYVYIVRGKAYFESKWVIN